MTIIQEVINRVMEKPGVLVAKFIDEKKHEIVKVVLSIGQGKRRKERSFPPKAPY